MSPFLHWPIRGSRPAIATAGPHTFSNRFRNKARRSDMVWLPAVKFRPNFLVSPAPSTLLQGGLLVLMAEASQSCVEAFASSFLLCLENTPHRCIDPHVRPWMAMIILA
jgi:hypothetical protein